jgi:hypothetical protein
LLGEAALAKFIDRKVDYEYKEGGVAFDFRLNNLKIDIKTAAKSYNCGLIRAQTPTKVPVSLKSDVYVFAYIGEEDRENKKATVILKGWVTKEEIEACQIVPAKIGKHYNYQIPYEKLRPIEELRRARKT